MSVAEIRLVIDRADAEAWSALWAFLESNPRIEVLDDAPMPGGGGATAICARGCPCSY